MKKFLSILFLMPILFAWEMPLHARGGVLEDSILRISRKIADKAKEAKNSKFAFTDFCETATGKNINLGYAIEDELSIDLIREMPGRLAVRHDKKSTSNVPVSNIFTDLTGIKNYAKSVSAEYLIGGSYYYDKEYAVININVIKAEDGIIIFSERVKIRIADLPKKLNPGNIA